MAIKKQNSRSAEEVVSMFLGLVIVMVVFGLVVNFFQKRKGSVSVPGSETVLDEEKLDGSFDSEAGAGGVYTVKKGDSLWTIAQNRYNSGYKWVEIAKENQLENPGLLEEGQVLKMPVMETEQTVATVAGIEGGEYKVERGDSLWNVAVRAYGDGYAWPKIWQANGDKLNSPDLLEIGMVLTIPRE